MRNYKLWSIVCLLLCVPLVLHLSHRRGSGTATVRFATFNTSLNRATAGALLAELQQGSAAARRVAEIVQRVRPDVLLLQEVDRDDAEAIVDLLRRGYLEVGQNGLQPIEYRFAFCGASNTGEPTGLDLDGDGKTGGPGDAFGFGRFPGQYAMVLLSRYPILVDRVRTFRTLPWSAMPAASRPDGYWSDEVWQRLRLSSKSHWDVPIGVGSREHGEVVHALCSHPTPPVFDGPEDRNGRRNHDEIRFWVDYLTPGGGEWIVDDGGGRGGLAAGESFVLLGDLNCDPVDGDARRDALAALLAHARVQDPGPRSTGGAEQSLKQFGVNPRHGGDAALDTGDFPDAVPDGPGNLRVDYVLPSRDQRVMGSGVFWPPAFEQTFALLEDLDHRLVFVDLVVPGSD